MAVEFKVVGSTHVVWYLWILSEWNDDEMPYDANE